jgi:indolepyruvate ferredoxin oxidoreductase beta subunit
MLPVSLAQRLERSPGLSAWIEKRLSKGRRIRSHTITGQLMLHGLASLRFMRRASLRHRREQQHLEAMAIAENFVLATRPVVQQGVRA